MLTVEGYQPIKIVIEENSKEDIPKCVRITICVSLVVHIVFFVRLFFVYYEVFLFLGVIISFLSLLMVITDVICIYFTYKNNLKKMKMFMVLIIIILMINTMILHSSVHSSSKIFKKLYTLPYENSVAWIK